MSTKNIMIVGVGGQGTLLASKMLGYVLLKQGYDVKVSDGKKSSSSEKAQKASAEKAPAEKTLTENIKAVLRKIKHKIWK